MSTGKPRARAALLLLADGRYPAGGYAHSGGLEPTVADGGVHTVADLDAFLVGRLSTVGLVAASFAAAACRILGDNAPGSACETALTALDEELDARMPSPAQRETSRQLGRQCVRALITIAPEAHIVGLGPAPHHPIALGAAYAALSLGPHDAALGSLHEIAAGPVAAAVRLLSVDPFQTHAVLARLGPLIDGLAAEAVDRSVRIADLPAQAAPLLDVNAERHRVRVTRLFAS